MTLVCSAVWLCLQIKWIHDRNNALSWHSQIGYGPWLPVPLGASAPWSIRLLGEPGYGYLLVGGPQEDKERLRKIKVLFPESNVIEITTCKDPDAAAKQAATHFFQWRFPEDSRALSTR
jgi:hypothetical protein